MRRAALPGRGAERVRHADLVASRPRRLGLGMRERAEHGERVRKWFQDKLRREAVWRNVVTPEGIQVPSESLGLSIVGHSMM